MIKVLCTPFADLGFRMSFLAFLKRQGLRPVSSRKEHYVSRLILHELRELHEKSLLFVLYAYVILIIIYSKKVAFLVCKISSC